MSVAALLIVFFVLLLVSSPISMSIAITSLLPKIVDPTFSAGSSVLLRSMISGVNSFPMLAIPMFMLSGVIMARGEISKKLFDVFTYFFGKLTAGVPCIVIVTCLFYGAISGSAPATVAAVGSMTIPVMIKLGYERNFSIALIAVAGGLGCIIPPSIPFVLYSSAAGTSVADMFLGGIVPGFVIAFCLMLYCVYYCKKNGEDRDLIDKVVGELRAKGFWKVFKESFWALLTPVVILGSIYGGIASPTEAATLSVFYALFVSIFVYKTIQLKEIPSLFLQSLRSIGPILFVIAAATAFGRVLALMNIPQIVSEWITTTFGTKWAILLVINIFLLFVGMVMDAAPAILILTPIFVPIMESIGVDLVHFGISMVVNLAVGFVTPPVGINLFVASGLTGVPVIKIARHALPLIFMFMIALILIVCIPELTLCLL